MPDDVVSSTIQLISETRSEQAYAVGELWRHLSVAQLEFQPMIQVATWCIGEFGDLLLNGKHFLSCNCNSLTEIPRTRNVSD